jgi:transposase
MFAAWHWEGVKSRSQPTRLQMRLFTDDRDMTPAAGGARLAGGCEMCAQRCGGLCAECARAQAGRRKRRAVALIEQHGCSISEAARRLGVDRKTVRRYLAEADHERELASYRALRKVSNRPIREAVERAMARDPELSLSSIARAGGFADATHVARLLGQIKTSSKVVRGVTYPGRLLSVISAENAARLVRAIGMDPIDFDDL